MTLINLRDIKAEQTNQDRARAAVDTYRAKPDKPVGEGPGPTSPKRHLDVDAVLARSLRRVGPDKM